MTTSNAAGNWNATGTWVGGVVPGNGVSAVLNHVVTVTANQTIGQSLAPGTDAITVNAGGGLVVNAGVALTVRGDVHMNNAPITMGAGAIWEWDASAASSPFSQHYVGYCGNSGGSTSATFTANGTSGAHCIIRSNAGGGTGSFAAPATLWNAFFTYTDFLNLGQSGVMSLQLGYGGSIEFSHCVFDTCGLMQTHYESDTLNTKFDNVTMKNTVGTYCLYHGNTPVSLTSGIRRMTGCVFDKTLIHTFRDYTITDTLFSGDPPFGALASPAVPWASFTGNLLVATGGTETTAASHVTDCYYLQTTTGNPHYFQHDGGYTIKGTIFEYTGTTDDGDCNIEGAPAGPITLTIEHCIGLPNGASPPGHCGTILSMAGDANLTASMHHNTWYVRDQSAAVTGETIAGHTGMIARFSDNLVWALAGATAYKLYDLTSTVNDVVAAANAHHNAGLNLPVGSNGKSYHNLDFTTGAPGTADVDGIDPLFVDSARDIAKWDGSIAGGAGSYTHALTELKKKNEAGYNAAYLIADLIAYVKAGFVPQAPEHHAASDSVAPSNGWIGALQGVSPPATGNIVYLGSTGKASTDAEDVTTTPVTTSGDFIAAPLSSYGDVPDTTVQDSKSNSWLSATLIDSGGAIHLQTFYVEDAITGASHTFTTVNATPTNLPTLSVGWFSGVKRSGALDKQSGTTSGSAAAIQAGSVTPAEPNELIIASCFFNPAFAVTGIDGGFTIIQNAATPSAAFGNAMAYLIQTGAAAPANPQWTLSGATYCAANLATFRAEPVAPAVGDLGLLGIG